MSKQGTPFPATSCVAVIPSLENEPGSLPAAIFFCDGFRAFLFRFRSGFLSGLLRGVLFHHLNKNIGNHPRAGLFQCEVINLLDHSHQIIGVFLGHIGSHSLEEGLGIGLERSISAEFIIEADRIFQRDHPVIKQGADEPLDIQLHIQILLT